MNSLKTEVGDSEKKSDEKMNTMKVAKNEDDSQIVEDIKVKNKE